MGVPFPSLVGVVPGSSPQSVVLSQTTFCDYREEGLDRRQSSQVTRDWETGQLVVSWVGHL